MRTIRALSLAALALALAVAAAAGASASRTGDRPPAAPAVSMQHWVEPSAVTSGQEAIFHVKVVALRSFTSDTGAFTLQHQLGPGLPSSHQVTLHFSTTQNDLSCSPTGDAPWSQTCTVDLTSSKSMLFHIKHGNGDYADYFMINAGVNPDHTLVTVWATAYGKPAGLPDGTALVLDVHANTSDMHGPDAQDRPDMTTGYVTPVANGLAEARVTPPFGTSVTLPGAAQTLTATLGQDNPTEHMFATVEFLYPPNLDVPDYAEYIAAQPVLRYGDGGKPLEGYDGWTWGLAVYATREQITLENGALWYQSRDPRTADGNGPRVQVSGANMLGLYGPLTDTNPTLLGYHFTGTFAGPGNLYPVWEK